MTVRSINVVTGEEEAREYTPTEQAANIVAQAQELADAPYRAIISLENSITPRRQREAMANTAGGTDAGRTWMQNIQGEIALLRSSL